MQFKLLAAVTILLGATGIFAAAVDGSIGDTTLDNMVKILELTNEVQAHLSHMITTGQDRPEFSRLVLTGLVDLIGGVKEINMLSPQNEDEFPAEQQSQICSKVGRFICIQETLAHYLEQEAGLITNFGLGAEIGQLIDVYESEIRTFESHLIGRLDSCADKLREERSKGKEAMDNARNQYPLS